MNRITTSLTLATIFTLSASFALGAPLENGLNIAANPIAEPVIMVLLGTGLVGLAKLINRIEKK